MFGQKRVAPRSSVTCRAKPALYQRVEAVVNRRVGNLRHLPLGADEDLLGGRMIALLEQHVIDLLPLRREPEAARVQPFGETAIQFFLDHDSWHRQNRHEPKACQDLE